MGKGKHEGNMRKSERKQAEMAKESEWQEYDKGQIRFEPFVPANELQDELFQAIGNCDLVIAVGPAGTGKSYVEAASALSAIGNKEVDEIILTRSPIPTGRSTGFNPGTIEEKLAPWLAPIMSNLRKAAKTDKGNDGFFKYLMDKKQIRMQELESIKGSSFDNAVIIVEEAQEMTMEELKNVCTRAGQGTRIVLNGDVKQSNSKLRNCDFLEFIRGIEASNKRIEDKFEADNGDPEALEEWEDVVPVIKFKKEHCVRSGICRLMLEIFEANDW